MPRTHDSGTITTRHGWDVRGACWVQGGQNLHSGLYYGPPVAATTGSGTAPNNALQAMPFVANRPCFLDRASVYVSTLGEAGSMCRVGIYADDGTCAPGSLVADWGLLPVGAGSGAVGAREVVTATSLAPGLYWLAAAPQLGPTTVPLIYSGYLLLGIELGRAAINLPPNVGYQLTGVSGPLPASMAGATLIGNAAMVRVHVA